MTEYKDRSRRIARERYWEVRDRETYCCPDCGRTEEQIDRGFEVHHEGGNPHDNRLDNLVALCRPCHNLREGKKPSLTEIQNLRDQVGSAGDVGEGEDSTVEPISTISNYNGNLGHIVCPGCNQALGHVRSSGEFWLHQDCCGVEEWDIPTAVVIDDELGDDVDTTDEGLQDWMVNEWYAVLKSKSSIADEQAKHVGWTEGGKPRIEYEKVELDLTGVTLFDIEHVAEQWGWESVAYTAKKARERSEPKMRIEAFAMAMLENPPKPPEKEESVSLGEYT